MNKILVFGILLSILHVAIQANPESIDEKIKSITKLLKDLFEVANQIRLKNIIPTTNKETTAQSKIPL